MEIPNGERTLIPPFSDILRFAFTVASSSVRYAHISQYFFLNDPNTLLIRSSCTWVSFSFGRKDRWLEDSY